MILGSHITFELAVFLPSRMPAGTLSSMLRFAASTRVSSLGAIGLQDRRQQHVLWELSR